MVGDLRVVENWLFNQAVSEEWVYFKAVIFHHFAEATLFQKASLLRLRH